MVWLGDVAKGRANNFNLIRFVAAIAVLVSHAYPITLGADTEQPLKQLTGYTLGGLSVFVFFAISGFFISASFARSRSARVFVTARALRLFPCLAVSLLLVALVMGPLVSTLPTGDFLIHRETLSFLIRNVTLMLPQYTLPGVFEDLPYPAVEGSIWTLVHEVACYGMVFLAGISGLLFRRRAMTLALLAYGVLWLLPVLTELQIHPRLLQVRELSLPFVTGMAFWLWRDRLMLSAPLAIGLVMLAVLTKDTAPGFPLLILALSYATFWCAYLPSGVIRQFNRFGDYSYGLYVYAFPLQGLVVWLWGPMGPGMNIALALPATLVCAMVSWHLLEHPALNLARASPVFVPRSSAV